MNELKEFEKKLKIVNRPQNSFDKDLKALENRLTLKLTKAVQRLGDVYDSILIYFPLDYEKTRQKTTRYDSGNQRIKGLIKITAALFSFVK